MKFILGWAKPKLIYISNYIIRNAYEGKLNLNSAIYITHVHDFGKTWITLRGSSFGSGMIALSLG